MTQATPGVRKALSLSLLQTYVSLGLNIATIVIVSRLLTPAEIGVFSVAVGLVTLVHMLRAFGVSEFVVQAEDLDEELIRTAFTVNLLIAWVLAAVLFACSHWIGVFYGDPGVGRVTMVLTLVFLQLPFGVIPMALMKRELRYDNIIKIRLGEDIVRNGMTIGLAYAGFSYMSMAWASAAAMFTLIVGCAVWGWSYRVRGMGFAQWKRVLAFGSNRTVADLAIQMGEQSANIVIGKMLGMAAAGLYSRGYGPINMFREKFINAVGNVAYPAYAREHRQTRRAPELYLKSMVYITGISWPFFVFAGLMAQPLIRFGFGVQWMGAVPLMQWLCAAAMVGTLVYQCDKFLTAVGGYREVTRVEVTYQTLRIGLCVAAAAYGLVAVAAVQVLVYVLAVGLYYRRLARFESLRPLPTMRALLPSLYLAAGTALIPACVVWWWPEPLDRDYLRVLLVAGAGAGIGWLGMLFLCRHPLLDELRGLLAKRLRRVGHDA